MVKKIRIPLAAVSVIFLWSCATYQPPPPSLHIEDLPSEWVSQMSLDERITAEDAWENLRMGNTSRAEKLISRLGSQSPFYHAGLGYAALIARDIGSAEYLFKTAAENFPEMPLGFIGLAQIYLERRELEDAFSALRRVLKTYPEHPWAKPRFENIRIQKTDELLDQAKTEKATGDLESSRQAYLQALYYSPDSVEAHVALAEIFIEAENYETALVHLKTASEQEPNSLDIQKLYADTLFKAENYKESLEA